MNYMKKWKKNDDEKEAEQNKKIEDIIKVINDKHEVLNNKFSEDENERKIIKENEKQKKLKILKHN